MPDGITAPDRSKKRSPFAQNSYPVIGPDGTRYDTISIAAQETGVKRSTIHHCLRMNDGRWRRADRVVAD